MIFINSSSKDSFKIFQGVSPIFVPFGLGYLMAVLNKNNIRTAFLDEIIEKNIIIKIRDILKQFDTPYIFGFNVLTATYKNALVLSKQLKKIYPESVIVFGGVHPTAVPDEVLLNEHVDIVVRGEAETIITELYNCIKNKTDISHIGSVSYKKNGIIIHNPYASILSDLDELPSFPRYLFDNNRYDHSWIMTARGCPYKCIFCSNIINVQGKCRFNSPKRIIEELTLLHSQYKRTHIGIIDDNLLVNKKRVLELAEEIKKSSIYKKVIFSFQARADSSNYEVLKEMYDAGFRGVYFGLETASSNIMTSLKKGESIEQVVDALSIAKKIGYHVSTNFIFGLPGETHNDRMDAIRLTKKLNLDLVKYNNATPFPGTELYNIAKKENRLFNKGLYENFIATSAITENPFCKIPLSYVPKGNTEKQIRFDILYATFKFYFSWKKLKRVFTKPELSNSWFDFGHSPLNFFNKLPSIILLLVLLSFKFGEMLIMVPFYKIFYYRNNNSTK